MDVINGTLDPIRAMFDAAEYSFDPFEISSVSEEAGQFLCAKFNHLGLAPVRFGDDPDKIKLHCMTQRRAHFRRVLAQHESAQARQKKKEFDPLPDSDAVIQAKRQLPFYDEAIGRLEAKLGKQGEAEHKAKMQELMESPSDAPQLEDASLEQLREEARRRGINFNIRWNRAKLLLELKRAPAAASAA